MSENNQQPQGPKSLNFDGKVYHVEDLTPRAADGFTPLVRVSQEVNELAYQIRVKQAAEKQLQIEVKQILKEDKVKCTEQEQLEEPQDTTDMLEDADIVEDDAVVN